jgi:hypothetical protein
VNAANTKSLFQFGASIDAFARKIGVQLDVAIRRVALEVYAMVTVKTPVDTGRARASWNISRGTIDLSNVPDTDGKTLGVAEIEGRHAEQIAKLKGAKLIAEGALGKAYLIEPIYITNNLPYIIFLEGGSSQQAPNGMVAITVAEIEARLRAGLSKI